MLCKMIVKVLNSPGTVSSLHLCKLHVVYLCDWYPITILLTRFKVPRPGRWQRFVIGQGGCLARPMNSLDSSPSLAPYFALWECKCRHPPNSVHWPGWVKVAFLLFDVLLVALLFHLLNKVALCITIYNHNCICNWQGAQGVTMSVGVGWAQVCLKHWIFNLPLLAYLV